MQTLNTLKKKLQEAMRLQDSISRDMTLKDLKLKKTKEAIEQSRKDIAKANANNRQQ